MAGAPRKLLMAPKSEDAEAVEEACVGEAGVAGGKEKSTWVLWGAPPQPGPAGRPSKKKGPNWRW